MVFEQIFFTFEHGYADRVDIRNSTLMMFALFKRIRKSAVISNILMP